MSTTSLFEGFEADYDTIQLSSKADDGIVDFAFFPDPIDMIVATKDDIQLWDYAGQHSLARIRYRDQGRTPSKIACLSDGTSFAMATEEGRVIVYTRTRKALKAPDGNWWKSKYLKSNWLPLKPPETYTKMAVNLWDFFRKEEKIKVPAYHFDLAFSGDGAYLAVAGLDGITVWFVNHPRLVRLKSVEESFKPATTVTAYACYALAFSPDNRHLAIGLQDGKDAIGILHLEKDDLQSITLSHSKKVEPSYTLSYDYKKGLRRVTSLAYSPTGDLLAVARTSCHTLALLEIGAGKLHELSRHKSDITCIAWSPNGNYIATGSLDKNILLWEVATRTCLIATEIGPLRHANVRRLSFSPDGRFLASCSSFDNCVRLWQARNPLNFSGPIEFLPESLPNVEKSELREDILLDLSDHLPEDKYRYQSAPIRQVPTSQPLPSSLGSTNDRSSSVETTQPTLVDYDHLWELLPQRATPSSNDRFHKHQIDIRDWTGYLRKGEIVGGGGFGDVYKAEIANTPFDDRMRCMPVAVKVIRPYIFAKVKSERVFRYVTREVQIWMSLRHPNVVPFVGISYDFRSLEAKLPALISAWMPNGSLKAYAAQHSEAYRAPMLLDIGKGLEFLHNFNPQIVHGDIKAENILVNSDGRLALGELLDGTQQTVTKESDIYAFAMTVVEVITGEVPFGGKYNFDGAVTIAVVTRDERPPRPEGMKNWLWSLVNDCWMREPSERLTVTQVIERLNDVIF